MHLVAYFDSLFEVSNYENMAIVNNPIMHKRFWKKKNKISRRVEISWSSNINEAIAVDVAIGKIRRSNSFEEKFAFWRFTCVLRVKWSSKWMNENSVFLGCFDENCPFS